jgi:hypothetical protein
MLESLFIAGSFESWVGVAGALARIGHAFHNAAGAARAVSRTDVGRTAEVPRGDGAGGRRRSTTQRRASRPGT